MRYSPALVDPRADPHDPTAGMLAESDPPQNSAAATRIASWLETLSRHGFTALFLAVTLVVTRAENASFALTDFDQRIVSTPTVEGIDIVARTRLFVSSVIWFSLAFPLLLAALRGLRRAVDEATLGIVEGLSIAGVALWLARAFTMNVGAAIDFVLAIGGALLAAGLLDRLVFRRSPHRQLAAYSAVLGIAAFGFELVRSDFAARPGPDDELWSPVRVGYAACALHAALRLLAWRGDRGRSERAFVTLSAVLIPAALLPIVSVLRNELYLCVHNAGLTAIVPDAIEQVLIGLVAIAGVAFGIRHARSGPEPDLERTVVGFALPAFVFGIASIAWYYPLHELPRDLFEPANPALFVQQFFDFGRIPFLETFNAHGLADSFWSFVYRWLHGPGDDVYGLYEFLNRALGATLIYAVLRRVTGNAYLAFFAAVFAPFRVSLFPVYCELALASFFVLTWYLARPNPARTVGLGLYCVFAFLWRLDVGAANLVATAATLAIHRVAGGSFRPRFRDLALGAAGCGAICGGVFLALALHRDVAIPPLLLRLKHIVDSSQGFGIKVAPAIDALVSFHLAVFPLAVLAVLAVVALHLFRARRDALTAAPLLLFLCFGATYYFANYQRGLVRHTFSEPGNVYLLSFGFAVLALSALLISWRTERARAVAFLSTASLLAGCFGLEGPDPSRPGAHETFFERAERHRRSIFHIQHVTWPIDRTPTSPFLEKHHYGVVRDFVARSLTEDQTFLDLTNSPMLYAITHRRSPHYLNHLYLVHDEWLQKDAAQEFRRHDIPFVFAWMDRDLARLDRVEANRHNFGDTVINSVRHWIFHEWLHRHYEPFCTVQRWETWRRKNWVSPIPPAGIGDRERFAARRALRGGFLIAREGDSDPALTTGRDRMPYLRFAGSRPEPTRVTVALTFSDGDPSLAEVSRELVLPAGAEPAYWTLPIDSAWRAITSIRIEGADTILESVTLCDVVASEFTRMPERVVDEACPNLGMAAWLWGHFDSKGAISRPVMRHLEVPPAFAPGSKEPRTGDSRMFFGPLEQPFEPMYVHVRLNRLDPSVMNAGIVWGRDDASIGRINFDIGGDGPQEYLIRVSSQYSWATGRCNWIQVVVPERGLVLESARILKGD